MPMSPSGKMFGTNVDGTKNPEYCGYCFKNGEYTFNGTMNEMIERCIPAMVISNPGMTAEDARSFMLDLFPKLKRWQ